MLGGAVESIGPWGIKLLGGLVDVGKLVGPGLQGDLVVSISSGALVIGRVGVEALSSLPSSASGATTWSVEATREVESQVLGLTLVILTSDAEAFLMVDRSSVLCKVFALVGSNKNSGR